MPDGHAGIVDRDALKRYADRILSLRADRAAINEDMGEVFKEAKDAGFVPAMIRGVVREMEMEDDARQTFFATQESYRRALGLLADLPLGRAAMDRTAPDYPTHRWGKKDAGETVKKPTEFAKQPVHRGRPKKADRATPDKGIWDGAPAMPAGSA